MGEGNTNGDGKGNGKARHASQGRRRGENRFRRDFDHQYSGRRFVVAALAVLLLVWGGLYLTFRAWRASYHNQTAFARNLAPPVVDGFLDARPSDVSEKEWRVIVESTHAMLDILMGANLLDRAGVLSLRDELGERVAATTPATSLEDVIRIWSDMELRAGPSLSHAVRPATIDLAIVIDSLERFTPPDMPPADWSLAVSQTRNMLIAWARSGRLGDDLREALRRRWTDLILALRGQPARAKDALNQIWIDVEREPSRVASPRPALLREAA
jgi:hypothetical protein